MNQYDLLGGDSRKQWNSLWNEATGVNDVRRLKESKASQEAYRRAKGIKPRKIGGMKKIFVGRNSL